MPDEQSVYIGLGSNLSDPAQQVRRAMAALNELADSRLISRSGLYRSPPMGPRDQPDFVNAVVEMATTLSARELLTALIEVERQLGRPGRHPRWGPRVIDLDLLVYGNEEIHEPGLVIPHPGLAERRFVLQPLADIAPDLMVPGLGRVQKILKVCVSDAVQSLSPLGHE